MMRPYGKGLKVYLHREPIDLRKGRNGLAAIAQEVMKVDPFSGALMIFVSKSYHAVTRPTPSANVPIMGGSSLPSAPFAKYIRHCWVSQS